MKQKIDKNFYVNLGFITFIFVLSLAFIKEYILNSSSILASGFSGLISAAISFGIMRLLKNRTVILKIFLVLVYVGIIIIFAYNKKNTIIDNNDISVNNTSSMEGVWITKEDDLTLIIDISDNTMKMFFYPNNKQLVFKYQRQGEIVNFFNQKDHNFRWKILKFTDDSLVVSEEEHILRFIKKQ